MRATGSGGSARAASASVACGGRSFAIARERAKRRLGAQHVDVVEDEHERRVAVVADGGVDRARDRGQQPPGVVVALVERHPGERARVALAHSRSSVVLP